MYIVINICVKVTQGKTWGLNSGFEYFVISYILYYSLSPTQQSLIEEHQSVDLSTSIDITDDTSLTLVSISDADINNIDYNSGNIATRVRAKNENARKNTVHKKSQHFNTRNLGNTSSLSLSLSESLS